MLNNHGFDLWADGYDKSVGLSDEADRYPFAGYKRILGEIYARLLLSGCKSVLDIGFGTGTLTQKLYEHGCTVYGQDFSARMLQLAQEKMPGAHLYQGDFSQGLASPLRQVRYDAIIATYSLHHLTDARKCSLIRELLPLLKPGGRLYVAFTTRRELEQCRAAAGSDWDEDEIYFVAEELQSAFPGMTFEPFSACAGILTFSS